MIKPTNNNIKKYYGTTCLLLNGFKGFKQESSPGTSTNREFFVKNDKNSNDSNVVFEGGDSKSTYNTKKIFHNNTVILFNSKDSENKFNEKNQHKFPTGWIGISELNKQDFNSLLKNEIHAFTVQFPNNVYSPTHLGVGIYEGNQEIDKRYEELALKLQSIFSPEGTLDLQKLHKLADSFGKRQTSYLKLDVNGKIIADCETAIKQMYEKCQIPKGTKKEEENQRNIASHNIHQLIEIILFFKNKKITCYSSFCSKNNDKENKKNKENKENKDKAKQGTIVASLTKDLGVFHKKPLNDNDDNDLKEYVPISFLFFPIDSKQKINVQKTCEDFEKAVKKGYITWKTEMSPEALLYFKNKQYMTEDGGFSKGMTMSCIGAAISLIFPSLTEAAANNMYLRIKNILKQKSEFTANDFMGFILDVQNIQIQSLNNYNEGDINQYKQSFKQ